MHLYLDVQSRAEADQIRRGFADPTIRAMVTILGGLLLVQDDRQQQAKDDAEVARVHGYTPVSADRI